MEQNFIENELIILTKQSIDIFLKENNPSDLISLYTFYYYTAKWQKTNQCRCTDKYVQKGLHWGYDKFIKAKKKLLNFGLIEQIINRKDNKIEGFYIKMNYIFKQKTEELLYLKPSTSKQSTNTLSTNNLNTLSTNNIELLGNNSEVNKLNNLIKDKIKDTSKSKEIKTAYKYYRYLKNGTFIKHLCLNEKTLKQLNIPLIDRKYSDLEIITGLNNLALQYEDGYYPFILEDKKRLLPKSLENAFFSNYGCKALLLKLFYNPPKLKEDMIKVIKDEYPEITKKIKHEIFQNKDYWSIRDENNLIRGVKTWYNRINDFGNERIKANFEKGYYTRAEMDYQFYKEFGTIDKFTYNFILFIHNTQEIWNKFQTDVAVFKNNFLWGKFINWINKELDIDILHCNIEWLRDSYERELNKTGKIKIPVKSLEQQLKEVNENLKTTDKESYNYEHFVKLKTQLIDKLKVKEGHKNLLKII